MNLIPYTKRILRAITLITATVILFSAIIITTPKKTQAHTLSSDENRSIAGAQKIIDKTMHNIESDNEKNEDNDPNAGALNGYEARYTKTAVRLREEPSEESEILGVYFINTELLAKEENGWSNVIIGDETGYMRSDLLSKTTSELPTYQSSNYDVYEEEILNPDNGTIEGPSGKETYYNLPMNYIVGRLKRLGYKGDYWIRDDGMKMYGDKIIVAANWDVHPFGSTVQTSRGMGLIADMCGSSYTSGNPYWIDLAANW